MLRAPLSRRRIHWQICLYNDTRLARHYRNGEGWKRTPRSEGGMEIRVRDDVYRKTDELPDQQAKTPSLYEQLFPNQEKNEPRKAVEGEVPRIPIPSTRLDDEQTQSTRMRRTQQEVSRSRYEDDIRQHVRTRGDDVSVLVLRNASKNLVDEDFRRFIPQGQHMEGWTLEQGDILQVIPGRSMETLEQKNFYFLLFKSALSAFMYQGHATRVHNVVASHTPSSILSPMLPPPGYLSRGFDAHAAIQSFSLVPPNQPLDLRQLKPPLSPLLQAIVRNGGYPGLRGRNDRMPYEARLTLEGLQLHLSHIRHILMLSGKDRGLSWSGDSKAVPHIAKWDPQIGTYSPSPMSHKDKVLIWAEKQSRSEETMERSDPESRAEPRLDIDDDEFDTRTNQEKRRLQMPVYIVGFDTEKAMQSFVRFWHRRPMEWEGLQKEGEDEEGDLAPVTNVEVLW